MRGSCGWVEIMRLEISIELLNRVHEILSKDTTVCGYIPNQTLHI